MKNVTFKIFPTVFATNVDDTDGVHLELRIFCKLLQKIEMAYKVYSPALGKMINGENLKSKLS
jgi:hypothetical protein